MFFSSLRDFFKWTQLYHGSNQKIEVPDLMHSKPFKDFGSGFYLSPYKQQAWDMAF